LLWESLVGELITAYDARAGIGCHPVLLLVDEAGRSAIPSLAEYATTVVGRGLNLWMAVQSLSQLEAVYGHTRAQVLRDNMETQVYYRPTDLATASYLEQRLGEVSAFAKSVSVKDGEETGEGRSERPIALLTAQEILQLKDEEVIAFHRRLPPMKLERVDWRKDTVLSERRELSPPILSALPTPPDYSTQRIAVNASAVSVGYIDPDS
jgi:type IV secretory pathway TraG/TraD family ATPase VirD4